MDVTDLLIGALGVGPVLGFLVGLAYLLLD